MQLQLDKNISILKYPPAQMCYMIPQTYRPLSSLHPAAINNRKAHFARLTGKLMRVSACNLGKDVDRPQHGRGSLTSDHSSHRREPGHRLIYLLVCWNRKHVQDCREAAEIEVLSPAVAALTPLDLPKKESSLVTLTLLRDHLPCCFSHLKT